METLWQNLRYALRTLFKRTGYTLVAVLTLALGIGAVSAVSSFFNAALAGHEEYSREQLLKFFEEVGLQREAADKRVSTYSKGMRQKWGSRSRWPRRPGRCCSTSRLPASIRKRRMNFQRY
jgi:hypothetical protein